MAAAGGRAAAPEEAAQTYRGRPIACDDRRLSDPARGTDARPDHSPSVIKFPGVQTTRRAKHNKRRVFLIFRSRRYLLLGQLECDAVALVGNAAEVKRVPVDDDFSAADTEEAAEIDHGGAYRAFAIHDRVDDAPHVLVGGAADLAAEDSVCIAGADYGDRWRRRGFFRSPLGCSFARRWRTGIIRRPGGGEYRKSPRDQHDQHPCPHVALP